MWHNNPKNPLQVNKPKAPAKPAALNASADEPKSSSSSLKFSTPEIRVGLNSAKSSMPTSVKVPKVSNPKMPKDKNVIIPKPKKMPKRKLA